jgi:hypothetical protein
MENYVGHGEAICLASQYDVLKKFNYLWFVLINSILLPKDVEQLLMCLPLILNKKSNMFGVETSMVKESSHALIIMKFYLFRKLSILPFTCANLLSWWQSHEK